MKLSDIKKIAFASALVVGGVFSLSANAQTNLVTSLTVVAGTSGSGLSATSALAGPSTNELVFRTNIFSIAPSQAYTLSFNLSRSIATTEDGSDQRITIQPTPFSQVIPIGTTNLSAGAKTYTISASTLVPYVGVDTRLGLNFVSDGTNLFSVSDFLFFEGLPPSPAPSGPSVADTQSSIGLSAQRLNGIYNLQSTAVVNGLTYDCRLFDVNNICLSTGGRYSNNHGAAGYSTSALLIGGYRIDKNIRVGAWVDQNLSTNSANGTSLSNSKPLFGVFGAWAENPSGEGYEVKVSAGYGDRDLTVTRDVIGTSEAGSGSTRLNTQAISSVSIYGFKLSNDVLASPYVGVQYSRVASNGYTEATATGTTAPLTYSRLAQENVSVLAGLKLSAKLDPKTALFGSVGVEQNVNNRSGQYSATGVDGLTAVNFNSNVQKTRATASAGVSYDIDKRQRVSLSGIYREEAFNPTATTTVFATYTVGL